MLARSEDAVDTLSRSRQFPVSLSPSPLEVSVHERDLLGRSITAYCPEEGCVMRSKP